VFNEKYQVLKRRSCWRGQESKESPSSSSRSPGEQSLTDRSEGPNGDTKYTIMILVKNIKGLSVSRAGKGQGFRKSPSSHNRWPRGRSLADRSVHCQNTIRGCKRRLYLGRNTIEVEIDGQKAPARLGICRCMPRFHATKTKSLI
jgi:hypothetical protein